MKNQTKILIGILAIVILVGGFLVWKIYQAGGNILIQTDKSEYQAGDNLKVKIKNDFRKNISFSSCYPYYLENKNENWEGYKYTECQDLGENWYYIEPNKEKAFEITLPEVSEGLHRLAIPICIGCKEKESFREDKIFYSNEFMIKKGRLEWPLSVEKYIFLEHATYYEGEKISGTGLCIIAQGRTDIPAYLFNPETKGSLLGVGGIDFEINENLKVVYTETSLEDEAEDEAEITRLIGIYEIPYKGDEIEINKVDSEGTIYFLYKGKEIVLKTGEDWKEIKTGISGEEDCKVKYTITDTIINYGILDKDKIQSW